MCWFSAEYASKTEQAGAGERLGIRKMTWHANWVVRETELESPKPCPVCLADGTKVLFRFSECQQALLHVDMEAEAVFKMLKPKLDVFEFPDATQIKLGDLPHGLIFDVLGVPGSEELSAILDKEPAEQKQREEQEREPFFARLLARF
jgi:hypothetical protein